MKDWSYKRKLQYQLKSQSSPKNYTGNTGNQIGVVFDYIDEKDLDVLSKYKEGFRSEGKFVKILAYINEDIDVTNYDFKAFSKKELSWEGIPNSEHVQEFLNRKYDVLFFPIREYTRPLEFISMVSEAKLKIGTYHESMHEYYDILLDAKPETRINDIFDQFLKHLNILSN